MLAWYYSVNIIYKYLHISNFMLLYSLKLHVNVSPVMKWAKIEDVSLVLEPNEDFANYLLLFVGN